MIDWFDSISTSVVSLTYTNIINICVGVSAKLFQLWHAQSPNISSNLTIVRLGAMKSLSTPNCGKNQFKIGNAYQYNVTLLKRKFVFKWLRQPLLIFVLRLVNNNCFRQYIPSQEISISWHMTHLPLSWNPGSSSTFPNN